MGDATRKVDVCVVGGGPAALAIASRLLDTGRRVLIVESGGRDEEANADLKVGSITPAQGDDDQLQRHGPSLYPADHLESGRHRGVGGSGNLWGVRQNLSTPFTFRAVRPDRSDFIGKPAFDIPAWPVPLDELDRWLDAACSFVGMPRASTAPSEWDDALAPFPFERSILPPGVLAFPFRTTITNDWVEAVAAGGAELLTGSTFVAATRRGGALQSVSVVCGRDEIVIEAEQFVLALGGVENARALLHLANDGVVDNRHDVIGRFFTDHPHGRLGVIDPVAPIAELGFYDFRQLLGFTVLGVHHIDGDFAHENDLLGFSVTLTGRPAIDAAPAAASATRLMNALRDRRVPNRAVRDLLAMARNPATTMAFLSDRSGERTTHHTGLGGWSNPATAVTDADVLAVECMMEQRPSPDNRVRLGDAVDRLGRRQARLEWSWSEREVDSYWRSVEVVREQVRDSGVGTFLGADELGAGPIPNAGSGWHHMGTTRMAADPAAGVVDPDGRVHGLDNLYVAGSSVFPSSAGWANPTLTVLALALRLGEHLGALASGTGASPAR